MPCYILLFLSLRLHSLYSCADPFHQRRRAGAHFPRRLTIRCDPPPVSLFPQKKRSPRRTECPRSDADATRLHADRQQRLCNVKRGNIYKLGSRLRRASDIFIFLFAMALAWRFKALFAFGAPSEKARRRENGIRQFTY